MTPATSDYDSVPPEEFKNSRIFVAAGHAINTTGMPYGACGVD
jgi:hypothetical protein